MCVLFLIRRYDKWIIMPARCCCCCCSLFTHSIVWRIIKCFMHPAGLGCLESLPSRSPMNERVMWVSHSQLITHLIRILQQPDTNEQLLESPFQHTNYTNTHQVMLYRMHHFAALCGKLLYVIFWFVYLKILH